MPAPHTALIGSGISPKSYTTYVLFHTGNTGFRPDEARTLNSAIEDGEGRRDGELILLIEVRVKLALAL